MRKYWSTLVLVALAALLGVYAWLDRGSVSVSEKKMRENDVFVAWRREDLTRIELQHGTETTVLVRAGDEWRLASPRESAVDAALVDRFLGALEFATVLRKVSGDVAGFDSPRARGTIVMGAVTYRFELGPPAPSPEGAAYFRFLGEKPVVVSKELALELLKGESSFRARTVVPYLSLDLARLEVFGHASAFTLERLGAPKDAALDARPFVVKDLALRASRDRLDRVWGALAEMRAEAFLPDDEAEKALGAPQLTLTMTPKDTRPPAVLVVGGTCPANPNDVVVVRRAPDRMSACVPKGIVDALGVSQRSLVDTRLVVAHEDEVEALRIEAEGAVLDIARKGGGWRVRAPSERDLSPDESDAATALVRSLVRAEGEVLGSDERHALGTPRARVIVTHAETGEDEVLELANGAGEEGAALVLRPTDDALVQVDARAARLLLPRKTALRPRPLFPEPLSGKPISRVETACNGAVQVATRDGSGYRLVIDGKEQPADTAAILDLVEAFARARADAWVADQSDDTFGFARETCSVHVSFVEASSTRTVGVAFATAPEADTVYGRLDGDPAVFVAPAALRSAVTGWLLDRHALVVDPALVRTLEVSGRALDSRSKDDAGVPLVEELSSVLTDTIHLGPARAGEGFESKIEVRARLFADAGRADVVFAVGAEATRAANGGSRATKVRYVRIPGIDATLAVPASSLERLLSARATP